MAAKLHNLIGFILIIQVVCFIYSNTPFFIEWEILGFYNVSWTLSFYVDYSAVVFSITVILITLGIFYYSSGYIKEEKEKRVFFIILFMFSLSIQILIFSFSLSCVLLGWDGLGVTSFYLILFNHNLKRLRGGLITIIRNRVGDYFIIIGVGLMLEVNSWNRAVATELTWLLSLFLIVASLTKSAQLPFSLWLPKAIAAPTPVSSLVHSSTLVTAGAYLIFRFNFLLVFHHYKVLSLLALATIILGGSTALCRFDAKEIVAFSTLRQVGFMVFVLSIKIKEVAFFHLITHALFKSVLFIIVGIMIHFYCTQDIRVINLKRLRPLLQFSLLLSLISIRGLPFLSGFYSKDFILDRLMLNAGREKLIILTILIISYSALYRFRLLFIVVGNKSKETPAWCWRAEVIAVLMLISGSVFVGSSYQWMAMAEFPFHSFLFKILVFVILYRRIVRAYKIFLFKFRSFSTLKLINIAIAGSFLMFKHSPLILDQGWLKKTFFFFQFVRTSSVHFNKIWARFLYFLIITVFLLFA